MLSHRYWLCVLCYFLCHITYENIVCLFTFKILLDLLGAHAEIVWEMYVFIRNIVSLVTCLTSQIDKSQFMTQGRSPSVINCELSLSDKVIQITRRTYIWYWQWPVNIFTKLSSTRLHILMLVWTMIPRSGDIQHRITHLHFMLLYVIHASVQFGWYICQK